MVEPAVKSLYSDPTLADAASKITDPTAKLSLRKSELEYGISESERADAERKKRAEASILQMEGESGALSKPFEEFKPSQETMGGFIALGSMLAVSGAMLGIKGKFAGLAAMNSIAGMMKGYQAGRKDLYEQERQKFEENMKVWERNRTMVKEAFDRALKMAPYNLTTAQNVLRRDLKALGVEIPSQMVDKSGVMPAHATMQNLHEGVDKVLDHAKTTLGSQRAELKAITGLTEAYKIQEAAKKTEEAGTPEYGVITYKDGTKESGLFPSSKIYEAQNKGGSFEKLAAPSSKTTDLPASARKDPEQNRMVKEALGVELGSDASNAATIAKTMAEAASMAKYINENPDVMGRSGQLNSFVDRYIKSFQSGDYSDTNNLETTSDAATQKSLLFAKRYAKFLTDYEQSIAKGAKGFTVALQNRYNQLMSSGQFNKDSFIELLREHAKEIASGATELSDKINYDNLMSLGGGIRARAGDTSINEAISFLKGKPSTSAAPAAPAGLPENSKLIGKSPDGKSYVYQSPDGKKYAFPIEAQ